MRRPERNTPSVLVVAMLLVALLGAVASGAAAVAGRLTGSPSSGAAQEPIDGYPQRIGFDRPSPKLPDRPGPLAATLYDNDFGVGRDLAVTSRGRLWELPPGINVLSPDGTLLLTGDSQGRPSQLVVHDLSTGDRRVLEDIGQTTETEARQLYRYLLDLNGPVHWSKDGSSIVARFGEAARPKLQQAMVLDAKTGALTEVAVGQPAGFRSPAQVVTVRKVGDKSASGGIEATTTDVVTGETQSLALGLDGPWQGDPGNGLAASVSPDGSTLLLVEAAEGSDATLRLFSLTDGSELAPRGVRDWDGCSSGWLGDDPVLPTRARPRGDSIAGSELVTADGSRSLVAVHHRLQSSCLQLTAAALDAGPHRALFGTWSYIWTWYWWQLLLAGSLTLFALAWILWRRQRRDAKGSATHRADLAVVAEVRG